MKSAFDGLSMRRLVFLENKNLLNRLKFPEGFDPAGTLFVCTTEETVVRELRSRGWDAVSLESFVDFETVMRIEKASWRCALDWFGGKPWSRDLTYRGINLGALDTLSFSRALFWIFKTHFAIKAVLASEEFSEIICGRDRRRRMVHLKPTPGEFICGIILEVLGVTVRWVDARSRIGEADRERPPAAALKGIVRFLAALSYAAVTRPFLLKRRDPVKPNVLFCAALHHIREVVESPPGRWNPLYLVEDHRLAGMRYLDSRGIPAWNAALEGFRERIRPSETAGLFLKGWKTRREDVFSAIRESRVFSYDGVDMFPYVRGRLAYFADKLFPKTVRLIDLFERLLRRNRIRSVVVDEDVLTFRRTLTAVAGRIGIPGIVICHVSLPTLTGHELAPLQADLIAVGGPFMKECCVRYGIPEERISVTGIARYDGVSRMNETALRSGAFSKLGIPKDRSIVVLVSTGTGYPRNIGADWKDLDRGVRDFLVLAGMHPAHLFVVKLRPAPLHDDVLVTGIIREEALPNVRTVRRFPTLSLLAASRMVVSFSSSCILESCLLKVPTIALDYFKYRMELPVSGERNPCVVRDREGLVGIGGAILRGDGAALEEARRFSSGVVEGLLLRPDGLAGKRISDEIAELARPGGLEGILARNGGVGSSRV